LNCKKELDGRVYSENGKMTKLSDDMKTIANKVKWTKAAGNTRAGGTPCFVRERERKSEIGCFL
jgi:hypothetical protein